MIAKIFVIVQLLKVVCHCEERFLRRSNPGFEIASLPSAARNDDETLSRTELLRIFFVPVMLILSMAAGANANAQMNVAEGQQMADFSLSGFEEKGRKSWDLTGKQADIASEIIKLNNIESNVYGEQDSMKLTAQRGDFDRLKGSLHLENDVVITTSSGAKLTTESLNWDRKEQLVSTPDLVNIVKDDVLIDGQGATANTSFNKINLEKNIKVEISNPGNGAPEKKEKIEISCDGPLEVDYQKNLAIFKNKVKVQANDGIIESDYMEIYFSAASEDKKELKQARETDFNGAKINRIVARGNVKITRDKNVSFCEEAVYLAAGRKITLTGRPKLVIYSSEEMNAPFGN